MVVFRNQRVGIDGGRSSPRIFKGGPISCLKRPVLFEGYDPEIFFPVGRKIVSVSVVY